MVNERNMELKNDMKSSDLAKSVLNGLSNNKKDPPSNIIQTLAKSDITTPLDQSVANSTNDGDQSGSLYSVNLIKDINDEVNNEEGESSKGDSSISSSYKYAITYNTVQFVIF